MSNRLIGRMPQVGIRPVIDGRERGVRESLEEQTMTFKDVFSVMANWGSNHVAISYGHIGAELITLTSMLRIPVCMHNATEDEIFPPSSWNSFRSNPESADYRACKNYGPMHDKLGIQ